MNPDQSESDGVGKSIEQLDADTPDDATVAESLGFSTAARTASEQSSSQDNRDSLCDAEDESQLLQALVEQHRQLASRVSDLERENQRLREKVAAKAETLNEQEETIKNLAATTNELREKLNEVDEKTETARDVAKSASAKAHQLETDSDQQEDAEQLPHGVEPSSSPLDFFANCRQRKVKRVFVEEGQKTNTYRAIRVMKWWDRFGTVRSDGSGVFFDRDAVTQCLTALLNNQPHPQTVSRVWEKIRELGGEDVVEKSRQVGRSQDKKKILAMDIETAEGLLEQRYIGLDLIDGAVSKASSGGVTPVVTGV